MNVCSMIIDRGVNQEFDSNELARKHDRNLHQSDGRNRCSGIGYAGLPVAFAFAEAGFEVVGFDIDLVKVEALNQGRSYISQLSSHTT